MKGDWVSKYMDYVLKLKFLFEQVSKYTDNVLKFSAWIVDQTHTKLKTHEWQTPTNKTLTAKFPFLE